jgi:hypothetical protein
VDKETFDRKDKELSAQIEELKGQRQKLKAEYLAANALPLGQPVIYRPRADTYGCQSPLVGQLCHITNVFESWDGMNYEIRKAKKDGNMAKSGKSTHCVKSDELEVVKPDEK